MNLKAFFTFYLLMTILIPRISHASCRSPDWSHWNFETQFTDSQKKSFSKYVSSTPILVLAEVINTNRKKDKLWIFQAGFQYRIEFKIEEILKGKVSKNILKIEYVLRAQKPKMATPFVGEKWVLAIQKIKDGHAEISSPTCGGLGFPISQTPLFDALKNELGS